MHTVSPGDGAAHDAYDVAASRIDAPTRANIDAFWRAFEKIAPQLDDAFNQRAQFDIVGETSAALGPFASLEWEYGPGAEGGHRLCVTAGADPKALVLARAIARAAPVIPGWTFSDVRPAEEDDDVVRQKVEGRAGQALPDLQFRLFDDEAHLIGVEVIVPPKTDSSLACVLAEISVSCLIGEADERIWIGGVRPGKPGGGGLFRKAPPTLSLNELKSAISMMQRQIDANLRDDRWIDVDLEKDAVAWSSLTASADPDAPPVFRNDLMVAITPYPERLSAALTSPQFHSRRFSREGETFAYFKIDGAEDGSLGELEDREDLENLIGGALREAGLGASIGGGTGRQYSYVELALIGDLNEGLEVMASALKAVGIGRNCWVCFDEPGLELFYVPIWPDAPPPPLPQTH